MTSPPWLALQVLARTLAPDDREQVMGDLAEVFADRVDAGQRFNRVWAWGQICQFVVAAAFEWTRGASLARRSTRCEGGRPSGRLIMHRFASGFRHAAPAPLRLALFSSHGRDSRRRHRTRRRHVVGRRSRPASAA